MLRLERVTAIDDGDITPEGVRRTGLSAGELRASIVGDSIPVGIELRLAGDDPRRGAVRHSSTAASNSREP
jgi:hypothetical protein